MQFTPEGVTLLVSSPLGNKAPRNLQGSASDSGTNCADSKRNDLFLLFIFFIYICHTIITKNIGKVEKRSDWLMDAFEYC